VHKVLPPLLEPLPTAAIPPGDGVHERQIAGPLTPQSIPLERDLGQPVVVGQFIRNLHVGRQPIRDAAQYRSCAVHVVGQPPGVVPIAEHGEGTNRRIDVSLPGSGVMRHDVNRTVVSHLNQEGGFQAFDEVVDFAVRGADFHAAVVPIRPPIVGVVQQLLHPLLCHRVSALTERLAVGGELVDHHKGPLFAGTEVEGGGEKCGEGLGALGDNGPAFFERLYSHAVPVPDLLEEVVPGVIRGGVGSDNDIEPFCRGAAGVADQENLNEGGMLLAGFVGLWCKCDCDQFYCGAFHLHAGHGNHRLTGAPDPLPGPGEGHSVAAEAGPKIGEISELAVVVLRTYKFVECVEWVPGAGKGKRGAVADAEIAQVFGGFGLFAGNFVNDLIKPGGHFGNEMRAGLEERACFE